LKADQRTLSQTLLPAGKISHTMLLGWFVAEPEQITADLAQGPFAELAPFYSTPNQRGMLAAFGKACDHLILDHLKRPSTSCVDRKFLWLTSSPGCWKSRMSASRRHCCATNCRPPRSENWRATAWPPGGKR